MGTLTTHVLDTAQGKPGAGILIKLYSLTGNRTLTGQFTTNAQGRTDEALLSGSAFKAGTWELVFFVAAYFREQGAAIEETPFLDEITVRFTMSDEDQHYHVPLLVSPWSYSTYRGS